MSGKKQGVNLMFHYTNKTGFNTIKSQVNWKFKASIPKAPQNPRGVYFTTLKPNAPNFYVKTRIPKKKQSHIFEFADIGDLQFYPGNRGRLKTVYYSPKDYQVLQARQKFHGKSEDYTGGA
jgi:hypothetical protein